MTVHVDGDAIVYIAGFASDSRNGPLHHCLHNIKLILGKIVKETGDEDLKIFLTSKNPKNNFRTTILESYKKNRSKKCSKCSSGNISKESIVKRSISSKGNTMKRRAYMCLDCQDFLVYDSRPVYYQELRDYLMDKYDTIVCKWGEADDWLGLWRPDWIATHDKDLYQLGNVNFYNIKSGETICVGDELGEIILKHTVQKKRDGTANLTRKGAVRLRKDLKGNGFKWFCCQMLIGDTCDNIIKIHKGDGPVWIYRIFNPLNSLTECWNMVKLYYTSTGNIDKLELMGQLLWVSRKEREMFSLELIERYVHDKDSLERFI